MSKETKEISHMPIFDGSWMTMSSITIAQEASMTGAEGRESESEEEEEGGGEEEGIKATEFPAAFIGAGGNGGEGEDEAVKTRPVEGEGAGEGDEAEGTTET
jgi:hypothetical protein